MLALFFWAIKKYGFAVDFNNNRDKRKGRARISPDPA
jgi:hypothetical protein